MARQTVTAYLDGVATPDPPMADVRLAVTEAVTNAVLHAYIEQPLPGEVRVRVALTSREIEVVVEDDGRGLLPRSDSPGVGLGLGLIAGLAERVQHQSSASGGTRLSMCFSRDPSAATLG